MWRSCLHGPQSGDCQAHGQCQCHSLELRPPSTPTEHRLTPSPGLHHSRFCTCSSQCNRSILSHCSHCNCSSHSTSGLSKALQQNQCAVKLLRVCHAVCHSIPLSP